jgi:hypothetical protein
VATLALFAASAFPVAAQGGPNAATTNTLPQVGGVWHGQEHYDPSLSVFLLPVEMNPSLAMTLNEDAAGNLTGSGTYSFPNLSMPFGVTGRASSNGSIELQLGLFFGMKLTGSTTGTTTCSNGSTGQVISGKFQSKEGFGTFSLYNCPVL